MIYATDLDRTLIYSESFLGKNINNSDIELVDISKVNSYISKDVAINLAELVKDKRIKFIPVTTRSISEYNRINIPGIIPEYAIVSNGGNILYKGNILPDWNKYIADKINLDELSKIVNELNKLDSIEYKSKIIDRTFVFTKTTNTEKTKNEIDALRCIYTNYKFWVYKYKIYVIPKEACKDNALKWLKKYLGEDIIIASGDGELDIPMLNCSTIATVPKHGTIPIDIINKNNYKIISDGINSPLDTFKIIKEYLK